MEQEKGQQQYGCKIDTGDDEVGDELGRMIHAGGRGEANSTSMVPLSFSRTMAILLIMAQISIRIMPMTPGTKLYSLFCCGL